jgi:hypothetical protein
VRKTERQKERETERQIDRKIDKQSRQLKHIFSENEQPKGETN